MGYKKFIIITVFILLVLFIFYFVINKKEVNEKQEVKLKTINKIKEYNLEQVILDNPKYENNDLKVIFEDKETKFKVLEVELKSHKSIDEVLQVGGGWNVVMYYDFNSSVGLKDALGDVKIKNMNDESYVEREWKYVYWVSEERERDKYEEVCDSNVTNESLECSYKVVGKEKYLYEGWEDYDGRDIPAGTKRIGLMVYVMPNDYNDGIWKIGDKEISKHAKWNSSLETNLMAWYKLDEGSGTNVYDSHGNYTSITTHSSVLSSCNGGIKGNCANFSAGNYVINTTESKLFQENMSNAPVFTVSLWFKRGTTGDQVLLANSQFFNIQFAGGDKIWTGARSTYSGTWVSNGSVSGYTNNQLWHHLVAIYDFTDGLYVYLNNTLIVNKTNVFSPNYYSYSGTTNTVFGAFPALTNAYNGAIDEIGVWKRRLSVEEIGLLFNNGTGLTYKEGGDNVYWVNISSNQTIPYGHNWTGTQFIANSTNESATITYNINDTTNFNINSTGYLRANNILNKGNYYVNISASDGIYSNYTIFNINVTENAKLNLPSNNSIQYYNPILFNFTINTTKGYLTNVSLFTNESGSWTIKNITSLYNSSAINYYNSTVASVSETGEIIKTAIINSFVDNIISAIWVDSGNLGYYRWTFYYDDGSNYYEYINNVNWNTPTNITFNNTYKNKLVKSAELYVVKLSGSNYIRENNTKINILQVNNSTNLFFNNYEKNKSIMWNVMFCNNFSECGIALNNLTFMMDNVAPSINIYYPTTQQINYSEIGDTLQLNFTANDTNLNSCWVGYNNINYTLTSCNNGTPTLYNITLTSQKNATIYANDSLNNINYSNISWEYKVFKLNDNYLSSVNENTQTSFYFTFLSNGTTPTFAYLTYNETNYNATITSNGANNYTLNVTLTTPIVESNTIIPFYWKINYSLQQINSSIKNQTIINVDLGGGGIGSCGVGYITLYNFTIYDEETKQKINQTYSEIYAELIGSNGLILQNYSNIENNTNPFVICIDNSSLISENLYLNLQLKYNSNGYNTRFYNIQNSLINSSLIPYNISLYLLNSSNSQIFKIIYRDISYIPVTNTIINVYRKNIGNGTYDLIMAPKTDATGSTTGDFVLNNVIYKIIATKNNSILSTYNDVIAICLVSLVQECLIDLSAYSEGISIKNFEETTDFRYNLLYNNVTNEIVSNFYIPSNKNNITTMVVYKIDALGTHLCNDTKTTYSGELKCSLPAGIGNEPILVKLYKNNTLIAQSSFKLNKDMVGLKESNVLIFAVILLILVFVGAGLSNDPIYLILFFLLGIITLYYLNIVNNSGFIGSSATILFFIISIIIILIKLVRRV